MRMVLVLHVIGGGLGLALGAVALYAAKGARLHRKSGRLFVYAMLTMSLTGAAIAALTGVETSVIAGLLAAYLVITALTTVRPPAAGTHWLDLGAMLMGLAIGLAGSTLGFESLGRGESMRDGMPVPVLFVFGAIALLASGSDVRMMRSGRLQGARRLARHLWRMCFALFIASASFFLGQSNVFPEPLRITPVLMVLALAPLAALVYWLWRVRLSRARRGFVGVTSREAV